MHVWGMLITRIPETSAGQSKANETNMMVKEVATLCTAVYSYSMNYLFICSDVEVNNKY